MAVVFNNNASSRLAVAIAVGATSLSVTAGEGAKFPSPTAGDWFPLTIIKASGALEIVQCTARSGDVLTITRAQEGTSAQAFSVGDRVELRLTAGAIAAIRAEISAAQSGANASVKRAGDSMSGPLAAPSFEVVGSGGTPGYVDLRASGGNSDYDVRIYVDQVNGNLGEGRLVIKATKGINVDGPVSAGGTMNAGAYSAASGRGVLGDGSMLLKAAAAGNLVQSYLNSDGTTRAQQYVDATGATFFSVGFTPEFRIEGGGIVAYGKVYAGNGSASLETSGNVVGSAWGSGGLSSYLANNMAPRPGTGTSSWARISGTLPAGGMWAWYSQSYNSNGQVLATDAGISPGGTFVGPAASGVFSYGGFAWRIS